MIAVPSTISFRVCVIGDSSVGKTAILNQLIDHTFRPHEPPTINANYQIYIEEMDDMQVELQIWDTAGQEKFRSLGPIYFRNAAGAIAVYDQTQRTSFEHLDRWIGEFTAVAGPSARVVVAGNKSDLSELIEVSFTEAEEWANERNLVIKQTSAKTGEGIQPLFSLLAQDLVKNQSTNTARDPHKSSMPTESGGGGGCC